MEKERINYNDCPLCNSKKILTLKIVDCSNHLLYHPSLNSKIVWKNCDNCFHIFTEGYYTDEACKSIFRKNHENQSVGSNIEVNRFISAKIVDKVLPYVSNGIWLDVGFGNGSLLFTAQEYGFRAIGIDLRIENVNQIKGFGIESYCQDITAFSIPEKCSVITMADVLEHIPYPKEALITAKKLLLSNGVLFISMPNTESIVWTAWDAQNINPYWGELEHYHNFNRTRLYSLLNECGLTAIKYSISERYRSCMEIIAIPTPIMNNTLKSIKDTILGNETHNNESNVIM